ncbi:MAG: zf-HC2 domain-containing protein [Candidatus Acidiferrales bacterium]
MDPHERYLELCAASTAGELTTEEDRKLKQHLAICASCRRAKREYEATIQKAIPALAHELASNSEQSDPTWPVEEVAAAFFKRVATDRNIQPAAPGAVEVLERDCAMDAVNLLEAQSFPSVPKLENGDNTAQEKTQRIQ